MLAGLNNLLQHRQEVRERGDFVANKKHQGVVKHGLLGINVGDEVRGQEALIKGHALGNVQSGLHGLRFLDRDHTILAHLLHCGGNHVTDLGVAGRDRSNISNLSGVGHLCRTLQKLLHRLIGSGGNTTIQFNRVGTGGYVTQALFNQRLREKRRGRGAVASQVVGLHRNGLHQLGTQILERIFHVDIAGDGHTIVGDSRATKSLVQHHIAATGAESDLHGIGQRVHTGLDAFTGLLIKGDQLCHM